MENHIFAKESWSSAEPMDIGATIKAIRDSAGDVSESVALPPQLYNSEFWFDFERQANWDREWICVGHIGLIPNIGDYFSITVIDEPLVVVSGEDGQIRTLSAVCQHRFLAAATVGAPPNLRRGPIGRCRHHQNSPSH